MTAMLSREAFGRAKEFLATRARKLEEALYRYEFEKGPAEAVGRELENYRNGDGGFGRGLEPDLRCPESSALAATTALQTMLRLDVRDDAAIERTLRYFRDTYDERINGWDIIPKAAENSPRAIWWEYGAFREHWGNPNAEIAGYFNLHPREASAELSETLNVYAEKYLKERCGRQEMHEMLCFVRWARTLPAERLKPLRAELDEFVGNCVVREPANGNGYGCYPLTLIESPESPYYSEYRETIPAELDRLIAEQDRTGHGPRTGLGEETKKSGKSPVPNGKAC